MSAAKLHLRPLAAAALLFALPTIAAAHRLDEYLQATRISIERDRIVVAINLTPGAEVVQSVLSAIDRDRDGNISDAEGAAYAREVIQSMKLSVDEGARSLTLSKFSYPSVDAMRRGAGIIRLHATGQLPQASVGSHRLHFDNAHRPDISVYLVNVLVPDDERIAIKGQSRDMLQRSYSVDYAVSREKNRLESAAVALPAILGLAMAATLYAIASRFN